MINFRMAKIIIVFSSLSYLSVSFLRNYNSPENIEKRCMFKFEKDFKNFYWIRKDILMKFEGTSEYISTDDLTLAVKKHKQKGAIASLITKKVTKDQVSSYGVVVSDENGRIKAFQEKPTVDQALSDSINTGIYLFEPEIFNYIPSAEIFDIGADLFPKLVQMDLPFFALPMDFEWVDIGKVPDYWSAIRNVLQGKVRQVQIPGKEIKPGVFTGLNVAANWEKVNISGPVYIGGMTRIEDGATIIGPSMIGPSCCICEGATIDNSIIFDYSKIGKGVRLMDKLVFGKYCVGKNGDHFDLQDASLDWLIADSRRSDLTEPSPQQKAMAELLGTDLINIPD